MQNSNKVAVLLYVNPSGEYAAHGVFASRKLAEEDIKYHAQEIKDFKEDDFCIEEHVLVIKKAGKERGKQGEAQ